MSGSVKKLAWVEDKSPVSREGQDFYDLRNKCITRGILFEDPNFPCESSSLYYSHRPKNKFEWKRPIEMVLDPRLVIEGSSRFNVQQGELGDYWLLAAVANLTLHRNLFCHVVPPDQSFQDNYFGIFHFRFWHFGKWIDVVIDDRLPTVDGKLAFLRSSQPNEFWSALLEKAYAKLNGSYEALLNDKTCDAMVDLTGGVVEMYDLNDTAPPNLFKMMLKAYERNSLLCGFTEQDSSSTEARTPQGLVKGHAYSITRVVFANIMTPVLNGKFSVIRLRNPWGNDTEWNGPWSDGSPEWKSISPKVKQQIGLTYDHEGEFWMSYSDFISNFDILNICNLNLELFTEEESHKGKKWHGNLFEGEWVRGVTAGGCRNHLETFHRNPQYRITLTDADEDEEENKCTMIVALMQKNRRPQKHKVMKLLSIGFAVYHLDDPEHLPKPLTFDFFIYNSSCARYDSFINFREVTSRFGLPPGAYCIIPSTFDPNTEGEFVLRVFTEHKSHMEVYDDDIAIDKMDEKMIDQSIPKGKFKQIEDVKVRQYFTKFSGEDNELGWVELQAILNTALREDFKQSGIVGFSKDVCRSMIAMLDVDRSGKLGFEEFKSLWVDIRNWKAVFKLYAKSSNGELSTFELREALNSAGYRLNNHILNVLAHRYGTKEGYITFDDFVVCAVKLKFLIDFYKQKDIDNSNSVSFTLEEWLEKTLYA